MPEVVDEVFRVVYVDGIWIARDCVVLVACGDEHVLSWHLARAETAAAWRSLLSRIAPPDMVVTDGGSGFASAVAARPHEAQARQGRVLVVLPARRMPEVDGGHAARDAHRRRRRPAEGALRHEGRGRLPSREMRRGPRVGGGPPQDEIPVPK